MPSSRSRRARLEELGALPFAHRGLHGDGVVENSGSAIRAAVDRGCGIEIDVRLSADFEAMVYHDETLDRLTGATGPLGERTAKALQAISFRGAPESMLQLHEALATIAGRGPLLIELKARGAACHPLCLAVAEALHRYPGPVGVMSFNPRVGHWFERHFPQFLRGLVVTEQEKSGWRGRIERELAWRWAQADFLACDIRDLPSPFAAKLRSREIPVYTWTVRSEAERERAGLHADQIIFEAPRG